MSFKSTFTMVALTIAIAFAGFTQPAEAAMVLRLDNGSGSVSVTDGDANDFCPEAGCISYIGGVGGWFLNITTGTSRPRIGPGALGLNSVDISMASAGILTISLTDTGFVPPAPVGETLRLLQRVTGLMLAPGATVSVTGYQSNSNAEFAMGDAATGPAVVSNADPFASVSTGPFNVQPPYSMTEVATISFGSAGGLVQFSSDLTFNPEPTGLVLVGGVILFTVRALRRRARPV